jgi:hypothetical protein
LAERRKNGEHVYWNSPQGVIKGEAIKEVTSTTSIKGHTAKATKEHPQLLVKSSKTSRKALHKPAALGKA